MILNNENAEKIAAQINEYLGKDIFTYLNIAQQSSLTTTCELKSVASVKTKADGEKYITFAIANRTGLLDSIYRDFTLNQFAKVDVLFADGVKINHTTAVGEKCLDWFKV